MADDLHNTDRSAVGSGLSAQAAPDLLALRLQAAERLIDVIVSSVYWERLSRDYVIDLAHKNWILARYEHASENTK